jgi:hypothetical protein
MLIWMCSANEQSSAAHKRSKAGPGRIIMVKGQKTRPPSAWYAKVRVHIKSDTADHFVERGGYFGHEMLRSRNAESMRRIYRSRGTVSVWCLDTGGMSIRLRLRTTLALDGGGGSSNDIIGENEATTTTPDGTECARNHGRARGFGTAHDSG